MIKLFLALLILSNPTLQTCSTGCLKCSTTLNDLGQSICLLCDQTLGFYLDGQSCKSSQDESCLKYGLLGNCELCESNYYFDPNANRCVPIPQQKVIDNCQYYHPDATCRMCQPGFLIQNNTCVKIENPIENCAFQTVATECVECISNYYLSTDFKKCQKIPQQDHCLSYSDIECQKCDTNYLYDKNVYQRQLLNKLNNGDSQSILNHLELETKNQYLFDTSIKKCEQITIQNCSQFTRFDQCKVCDTGYYLNQKLQCIINPQPRIDNCLVYTSLKNCLQCMNGYYRKKAQICEKIKPSDHIQRCQKYSQTKSIVQCDKCEQEFYLQDNLCKQRQNQPIKNCFTYDIDEDVCQTCDKDYVLSSDRLQCLQKILNCQQHIEFTSNSLQTDLKCQQCVQTHYLQNGECIQGTQQNCENYMIDANQCQTCQNGFFSIPECIEQSEINECQIYSKDKWNYCDQCSNQRLNIRINNQCQQLPEITNCKIYVNNSKLKKNLCQQCNEGFYRDNSLLDQTCQGILTNNCATAEDNTGKCLTCKNGYGLVLNKKTISCSVPFQALTQFCKDDGLVQSNDNVNKFQCNKCQQDASPLVNTYNVFPSFCISQDRLNFLPKYFNQPTTFKVINNCVQYLENDDGYPKCVKCSKGFFVSENSYECVANFCKGTGTDKKTFSTLKHLQLDTRSYVQPNRCESDEANNYVKGVEITSTISIITLSCKHNLSVVDLSTHKYSNINPKNLEKDWIEHHLDVFPEVDCPASATQAQINGGTAQDITDNLPICQYFYSTGSANIYNCLKCPFGQQFSQTPSGSNDFLSTCRSMSTCDTTVKYKGIHAYWNKLFSCHKCKTSGEIPVIAYDTPGTTDQTFDKFTPFSLSNHDWTGTTNDRSSQLFCMNVENRSSIISKLSLGNTYDTGAANEGKLVLLTNCGLAFLNLKYTNAFDNTGAMQANETTTNLTTATSALLCAQCKPGYENIYYNGGSNIVSFCKEIDGCDMAQNQTWFGNCSQCESGKTYSYESETIMWNKCVTYPHDRVEYKNCLAWEITDSNQGQCRVCKKGYVLNQENHHCEKLTVPTCTTNVFRNQNIKTDKNPAYFLFLNQHGSGCHTCNSGMINYGYYDTAAGNANKFFPNLTICIKSDLVKNDTTFGDLTFYETGTTYKKSFYINHCLIHEVNRSINSNNDFSSHKCNKCQTGYILRDGGKKCELESTSTNCLLLHATDQNCLTCKVGYALQRNATGIKVCIQGQIANCLEYYTSQLFTSVRCKNCEIGYYFNNNKCVEGKVPNCNKYDSDFICTECNENYWLVGEANSSNNITKGYYCLKKDLSLNCKVAYFTGLQFHCKECQNDSQKLIENDLTEKADKNVKILQTKCLEYVPIQNCEVHSKLFQLKKKSLFCEKCNKNYYVQDDGYLCKQRQNFQDSCIEYVANEDKCSKCMTGYFLNTTSFKCDINPTGDQGCRKYSYIDNNLKCLSCGDGQYLDGIVCKKVSIENKVPQCQYYKTSTQCEQCFGGFYLNNNQCNNITVDHCVQLVNENSCKVCKEGYRLLDKGEVTICEKYDKLNCIKFNQTTLVCEICDQSFFPDNNGNCVQVVPENLILNCEQYRKDQLCAKCTKDNVLSLDLKSCNAKGNFDQHCIQQRKIDIWDCNVCKTGFRFVGEICKSYNDSIQGCFIRDVNNIKKCSICQSGYYMERGQNCAKNI